MSDDFVSSEDLNYRCNKKIPEDSLMDSTDVLRVLVYQRLTKKYEYGTMLPSGLLLGLIHGESAGDKNSVSKAGARGLVQLTDIAVKDIKRITGRKINPLKENEAIWGASRFICYYASKYKSMYRLSIRESIRYAAIYYLGGVIAVKQYRKGKIVIDKYTGISVSDYAEILLKRCTYYNNLLNT
jgi:Transglycosylase SLT domain